MRERVAIVGSRDHPSPADAVRGVIDALPTGAIVISGGASQGIDYHAREIALVNELEVIEYAVDARTYPDGILVKWWQGLERAPRTQKVPVRRGASVRDLLIFRNSLIAINCDHAHAFTRATRGGTIDAIEQFKRFHRLCTTWP